MGIDPITHEPLNKQAASQDSSSSPAEILSQPDKDHEKKEIDGIVNSEENSSSSPTENSSGEESLLLDSICSDDSLMNSLWLDETPLVEALWEMDTTPIIEIENTKNEMNFVPSWEDNCSWLLDCQDFGIQDFGFNCFNEIESSTLQTIGMKENI
jgi:myb proto-oncogene protein